MRRFNLPFLDRVLDRSYDSQDNTTSCDCGQVVVRVQSEIGSQRACQECGNPAERSWEFCGACGASLQRECPACGRLTARLPNCVSCGEDRQLDFPTASAPLAADDRVDAILAGLGPDQGDARWYALAAAPTDLTEDASRRFDGLVRHVPRRQPDPVDGTSPLRRASAMISSAPAQFLAGGGIASVGMAELLFERHPTLPLPPALARALAPGWGDAGALVYGVIFLLVGAPLFARGVGTILPFGPLEVPRLGPTPPGQVRPAFLGGFAFAAGLYAWAWLRLASGAYGPEVLLTLVGALLVGGVAELWQRPPVFRRSGPGTSVGGEAVIVIGCLLSFLALNLSDLDSWLYATSGGELGFWADARRIATTNLPINPFLARSVDGTPWSLAAATSLGMRVLGTDVVGWKSVDVFAGTLLLVATWALARTLYGRRVALIALTLVAFSHHLLSEVHAGDPAFCAGIVTTSAVALFVESVRRRSFRGLLLAGFVGGLGWYGYPTGRVAILILIAATLIWVQRRDRPRAIIPLGFGFGLATLPLLAVSTANPIVVAIGYLRAVGSDCPDGCAVRFADNVARAGLSPLYNDLIGPYLAGSLLEPLSAVLLALGVILAIVARRDPRARLLLVWYALGAAACAFAQSVPDLLDAAAILLPVAAVLAAQAAATLADLLADVGFEGGVQDSLLSLLWPVEFTADTLRMLALVSLIGIATIGNLNRWFIRSPFAVPSTNEALAIRALEYPACRLALSRPYVITRGPDPDLTLTVAAQPVGSLPVPNLIGPSDPDAWVDASGGACVVFPWPSDPASAALIQRLNERWPVRAWSEELDLTGTVSERVYYPLAAGPADLGP